MKFRNFKNKILVAGILIFSCFAFAQDLPYFKGQVYVCPLATKMEEVNPRCQCRIDLKLNETVISTCPLDGKTKEKNIIQFLGLRMGKQE